MKKVFVSIFASAAAIGLLGGLGYFWFDSMRDQDAELPNIDAEEITNFEECAAAGYPVMESYPRQCAANGQTFVEILPPAGEIPGNESMNLTMKTWGWTRTLNGSGTIRPEQEGVFTITFGEDGRVGIHTDCNSAGGTYTADDIHITFSALFQTEMYCENSQESEFLAPLGSVQSYFFTRSGELVLETGSEKIYFR